ncbi:hypothetical protein pdam_00024101, partial [Pocillopora damicornis]
MYKNQCRILAFPSTLFFVGERLVNHTIANISVIDRDTCEYRCYLDYNCVSVNFYFGEKGAKAHNCELNNSTGNEYEKNLVKAADYVYHGTKNFCAQSPCENDGTCQSGFTRKRYRCLCASGFTGHDCQKDIDECALNSHKCSENANCTNTAGSYTCSCNSGFSGDGHECVDIDECANDTHNCSKKNGNCTNVVGSYNCSCNPGFTGDGHICQDIEEYAKITCNCSNNNATCISSEGSFECVCKPGFSGDGQNCTVSEVSHQLSKGRFCSHTKNLVGKRAKKKNHAKTDLWCHSAFQAIFTNLGAVGREGPKSLGSYYAGQDQDGQVTLSKGIQLWTVPYTGKYRIETIGAAGGYHPFATGSPQYRGRGTIMIGTFELNKGDAIQILVGQEGGIGGGRNGPGGGG